MNSVLKTALAVAALAGLCLPSSAQASPPNDNLADAIELVGTNIVAFGSNVGATHEEGENLITPGAGGKTVWWTWVPPKAGTVTISTHGSPIDTVVAIYRQWNDGLRFPIAFGDDSLFSYLPSRSYPLAGQASALVSAGTRYYIGVDGHAGDTGDIKLTVGFGSGARVTAHPRSVAVGRDAVHTFSASVAGTTPIKMQWEKDGQPLQDATNASYTLPDVTESDAGTYRLVVSNEFGFDASAEANATVLPIAGSWTFENPTIAFGQSNSLKFVVSGAEPIAYRWEKDGVAFDNPASNLVVQALQPGLLGAYRVSASNSFGSVTSSVSVVTGAEPWNFVTLVKLPASSSPHGIALGTNANLLVSDIAANLILSVGTNGSVATIAGVTGAGGYADGPAAQARFNQPWGLCLDGAGNIVVADTLNDVIRRISPEGVVSTLAGKAGTEGYVDGNGTDARFRWPAAVVAAPAGDIFVADYYNCVVRRIDNAGAVSTWAGKQRNGKFDGIRTPIGVDGPADHAVFYLPVGVALEPSGSLLVADEYNQALRRISLDRIVSTVAGGALVGFRDGRGADAAFQFIHGPAVGPNGITYVADDENQCIRRINAEGNVVTIGGQTASGSADGAGPGARFNGPRNLVLGTDGCLYVADFGNHAIRKGIPGSTLALITNATDRIVAAGTTTRFGVRAAGYPILKYQWLLDGQPVAGQTASALTVGPFIGRSQSGSYSVIISNAFGSITSPPVHVAVVVRQQIQPPEPLPGGGLRLHFADETADGIPSDLSRLELQWRNILPSETDTDWQSITNGFHVEDGFIVLDLPPDESATNRFFRVIEH